MAFTKMIIILIGVMVKCAESELFSAIAHLDPLLHSHASIIDAMEIYLSEETLRLDTIKTLMRKYKKHHKIMEMQPDYIGNPLNAFTLIKRLTTDLELIELYANKAYSTFNKSAVSNLPTMEDLEGAGSALLRIQNCYKLNATELSQGVIQGNFSHGNRPFIEKVSALSSSDLFELGRRAYAENDFPNAIIWLVEALDSFKIRLKDEVVNFGEADLKDLIREMLDNLTNSLPWNEKLIPLDSDDIETNENLEELKNLLIEDQLLEDSNIIAQLTQSNPYLELERILLMKYYNLCRGSSLPNNVTKILRCYYKSGPERFLNLARIKVEVLHQDPDVLIFHSVISDAEIKILKQMSIDELRRSNIVNQFGNDIISPDRISKQTWIADDSSPMLARISQRVADLTDMDVENAEKLQVVNYGIGGHVEMHLDRVSKKNMGTRYEHGIGDRISTALFYLSDVEQGGATTFENLGLTVFPIKNAAIFWMNLLPSGVPDKRTFHGGCPVLRGSKWIFTKWCSEGGQELRRPCPRGFQ